MNGQLILPSVCLILAWIGLGTIATGFGVLVLLLRQRGDGAARVEPARDRRPR